MNFQNDQEIWQWLIDGNSVVSKTVKSIVIRLDHGKSL